MNTGPSPGLTPDDARTMLADLREETARLGEKAAWQFLGGDPAADARAADALAAQLDGVPALRRLVPMLAEAAGRSTGEVLTTIGDYEQATGAALERTRSGQAPEQPRTVPVAPTETMDAADDPRSPPVASSRPPPVPAAAPATGMGAAEPARPSLRSSAVVAAVVLLVVVVVVVVVLAL